MFYNKNVINIWLFLSAFKILYKKGNANRRCLFLVYGVKLKYEN